MPLGVCLVNHTISAAVPAHIRASVHLMRAGSAVCVAEQLCGPGRACDGWARGFLACGGTVAAGRGGAAVAVWLGAGVTLRARVVLRWLGAGVALWAGHRHRFRYPAWLLWGHRHTFARGKGQCGDQAQ